MIDLAPTPRAAIERRITAWEAEKVELAKLIIAKFRTPTFNAQMQAEAAQEGVPLEDYRLTWIAHQRGLRDQAIAAAREMLAAHAKLIR